MVNCSAIGCTNRSADQPEISFHQVPTEKKNKSLRKHWLHNIRRAGELPKDTGFFICSTVPLISNHIASNVIYRYTGQN